MIDFVLYTCLPILAIGFALAVFVVICKYIINEAAKELSNYIYPDE
jgi:hypothetical protein